jgi:hypothetical protein
VIELGIDEYCSSCPEFEVEDFKTELGDHILLCKNRKWCWEMNHNLSIREAYSSFYGKKENIFQGGD